MPEGEKLAKVTQLRPLDHGPLEKGPDLKDRAHMYEQLKDLSSPLFMDNMTYGLNRIASHAAGGKRYPFLKHSERETARILARTDVDNVDLGDDDQTPMVISHAIIDAGNDPERIRALETLLKIYVIASDGGYIQPFDVQGYVDRIMDPRSSMPQL